MYFKHVSFHPHQLLSLTLGLGLRPRALHQLLTTELLEIGGARTRMVLITQTHTRTKTCNALIQGAGM